ncbi:cellulose biosynthesis protein BcsN [Methylocystis heyeri]|uniref:Cellulose biosynthesis protein BcsN n=1 Tax=Methylocystis heyeri TaxID=391905 RepID=A0A6B8KGY5_9HYPH|nr:cellulose biosynthesis protein BcsN [Methylocystis heyeri]QGM47634.1 hypothetical protein H2LOC_019210 [Methylocystis heyeri]
MIPLMLVAALSACSTARDERAYVGQGEGPLTGEVIGGRAGAERVPGVASNFELVMPAEMGRPLSLSEKPYVDGWRQSVSLDTKKIAGDWNDLSIDIRFENVMTRSGPRIPMGPPTQDGIKREILGRFPGLPMRVVGRRMTNAMGPFGLAIGAAGRLRCAFAWQWVDDLRSARAAEVGGLLTSRATPASIRMRICRTGVTVDQLASWFELLNLADPSVLDRIEAEWKQTVAVSVAEAPVTIFGPSPSPGQTAAAEIVGGSSLEASLVSAPAYAPTHVAHAGRPRRHYAAVSRRRRAAERKQEDAYPAATAVPPSYSSQPQGGRYLAPVDGAAQNGAPQPGGGGSRQTRFDSSLPPQALRGPTAAQLQSAAPATSGQRYLVPLDGTRQ